MWKLFMWNTVYARKMVIYFVVLGWQNEKKRETINKYELDKKLHGSQYKHLCVTKKYDKYTITLYRCIERSCVENS